MKNVTDIRQSSHISQITQIYSTIEANSTIKTVWPHLLGKNYQKLVQKFDPCLLTCLFSLQRAKIEIGPKKIIAQVVE